MKIQVVTKQDIEIDLDTLVMLFATLDDDSQAQFFVKVAAYALAHYESLPDNQWWYIGRHLKTCECSTEDGREMVRTIAKAMES